MGKKTCRNIPELDFYSLTNIFLCFFGEWKPTVNDMNVMSWIYQIKLFFTLFPVSMCVQKCFFGGHNFNLMKIKDQKLVLLKKK